MSGDEPLLSVDPSVWVSPSATLTGRISIAEGCSVWHNAVMRAECREIRIGRMSNIQDFAMVHVGYNLPTHIGEFCSITHHATVHGCTLGDHCLVGIGAVLMDGCVVGEGSIVASGAVIPEGKEFAPHSVIAGVPAKVIGERDSAKANRLNAWNYHRNALATQRGDHRAWDGLDYAAWVAKKTAEIEADADL